MGHVAHMNESWGTHMIGSWHTWMSHVAHMNCRDIWIWMSHFAHMNESWGIHGWVMSHTWMSHVAHTCHTCEWVKSHIWTSHATHIKTSRDTYSAYQHLLPFSYLHHVLPIAPPGKKKKKKQHVWHDSRISMSGYGHECDLNHAYM